MSDGERDPFEGLPEKDQRFVEGVCAGDERGGAAAQAPLTQRFGFLKAPRSTVIQPGPVHGGVTTDPARQLQHLVEKLVS